MTSMASRVNALGLFQATVAVSALVWACNADATKPLIVGGDSGTGNGGEDASVINPDSDASTTKDGGTNKDGAADAAPPGPLCGSTLTLANSTVVAGVKAPFSLSDDELVIAWATGAVPNVVVHIAERTKRTDAFVEVDALDNTDGTFALDRPVLEARGFDVGMLDSGRQTWHLFSRQTRGDVFARSQKGIFQKLIEFSNTLGPNELLHDPVWAGAGRTMIFGVSTKGIYNSNAILGADDFAAPTLLSSRPELAPSGANRRRPSGLSGDGLTFLYFDEVSNQSMAAVRTNGDFATFSNLGAISDAKVGLGCKTIYYSDGNSVRVATQP